MSLKSWKEEFYYVEAKDCPPEWAIRHAIRKWVGLRPANMAKHGLVHVSRGIIKDPETDETMMIDAGSCSLCHLHMAKTNCRRCPLYLEAGGVACDSRGAPYALYAGSTFLVCDKTQDRVVVEPMIAALKRAAKLKVLRP
jgi:hypothetical protein